jgi:hypothetical protein
MRRRPRSLRSLTLPKNVDRCAFNLIRICWPLLLLRSALHPQTGHSAQQQLPPPPHPQRPPLSSPRKRHPQLPPLRQLLRNNRGRLVKRRL